MTSACVNMTVRQWAHALLVEMHLERTLKTNEQLAFEVATICTFLRPLSYLETPIGES